MENNITIEQDVRRMDYIIRIHKEDIDRAFTSQTEYNNLITNLSKIIYNLALKHGDI